MIYVVATLELNAGARDAYLAAFAVVAPKVRAEAGCVEYVATTDFAPNLSWQTLTGADCITIVERWETIEALNAHSSAPHMLEIREQTRGLVRKRAIAILSPP